MVDYFRQIIVKCLMDLHSPITIVGLVISAANTTVDIRDENKFATALE